MDVVTYPCPNFVQYMLVKGAPGSGDITIDLRNTELAQSSP